MRESRQDQTFGLRTSFDLLQKLAYERKRLDAEGLDLPNEVAYITINGAISAWHMCDWIFASMTAGSRARLAELMGKEPATLGDVQKWARTQCSALVACDHIANAAKHFERHPGKLDLDLETEVEWWTFHRADGTVDLKLAAHVRHGESFSDPRALLDGAYDFWIRVVAELERAK